MPTDPCARFRALLARADPERFRPAEIEHFNTHADTCDACAEHSDRCDLELARRIRANPTARIALEILTAS